MSKFFSHYLVFTTTSVRLVSRYFTDEATEAKRGSLIGPRSYSKHAWARTPEPTFLTTSLHFIPTYALKFLPSRGL